jgi:hypothetical protein
VTAKLTVNRVAHLGRALVGRRFTSEAVGRRTPIAEHRYSIVQANRGARINRMC